MPSFVPDATTRAFSNKKLRQEWQTLTAESNTDTNQSILNQIITAYSSPSRRYHDSGHIVRGLYALKEFNLANPNALDESQLNSVKFAWIFHDFAHGGHDDEEISAKTAAKFAEELGYDQDSIANITTAILYTKHDTANNYDSFLGNLLADIDLTILGQSPETYRRYAAQIRQEYAHFPDSIFNEGRKQVLQNFINRSQIFRLPYFTEKYENPARQNLLNELRNIA
jgi:predicted metal-dependent HD superfamily phosphohydrolase